MYLCWCSSSFSYKWCEQGDDTDFDDITNENLVLFCFGGFRAAALFVFVAFVFSILEGLTWISLFMS